MMRKAWTSGLIVLMAVSLVNEVLAQRDSQETPRKVPVKATQKQSAEKRNTYSRRAAQARQSSRSKEDSQLQQRSQLQKKNSSPEFPKVILIDEIELRKILTPKNKPLLVNFWATWCDPCREEFPDLVKISSDYSDRLDVITVSFDDPVEINRDVPKFLAEMNAKMPAYLLKAADEYAVISSVSPKWQGGLPFTILISADGKEFYSRFGKFNTTVLREQIEKLLSVK